VILVTGFDPFDGATENPTQRLVAHVAALGRNDVTALVLPTSYRRAEVAAASALRTLKPRVACLLGLHAGASTLRFEQVALNLNQARKPDNDGELRPHRKIRDDGPVGYFSTLPFEAMQAHAVNAGELMEPSRDAGGFVCNHVFYTVADLIARESLTCRAGFVHVPLLDDRRFARMCKVVEAWLDSFRSLEPATTSPDVI
jgi:pyroglutamyl-peptidase